MNDYGLGRLPSIDPRDRRYAASSTIFRRRDPNRLPARRKAAYKLGLTTNQGSTSQCVGFSTRHKITAAPIMVPEQRVEPAFTFYKMAQDRDEWQGNSYEGSSVRGGVEAARDLGYIANYVWLYSAEECEEFLHAGWGTILLGTSWLSRMFDPDPVTGVLTIDGYDAGGHAYHLFWIDKPSLFSSATRFAWIQNSWGDDWGIHKFGRGGIAKIALPDLDRLIKMQGEACGAVEQKVTPVQ